MEKLLWVLTTIQLTNLIRYGDFQNLVAISPNGWQYCGSNCNGIWSVSSGDIQIHTTYVGWFNNQNVYTSAADMQNSDYIRLCQNVSSMQVGSIYRFAFDMKCYEQHTSCSIWVIINNEVVNGSNQTRNAPIFQNTQGYLNSTQPNNEICFQSRDYPYMQWFGALIDNIILQEFNGQIPCNVPNCELCVLNFPNSCSICLNNYLKQQNQTCTASLVAPAPVPAPAPAPASEVFITCSVPGCEICVQNLPDSCSICLSNYIRQLNQTCTFVATPAPTPTPAPAPAPTNEVFITCSVPGCEICVQNIPDSCSICLNNYVKQQNQTCTLCSTVIANCFACQLNYNQYICLQCFLSFELDNQNSICFENQAQIPNQNSGILFTSEVYESSSIDNSFKIKTNLSIAFLTQAAFTMQNLPSIIIKINEQRQQSLNITVNEKGFLEVKINLLHSYQSFQITFQIEQGFVIINNTLFSIETSVKGRPSTAFFSEKQISILQKSDEIAKPILQTLDASFAVIKSSGFGFFVANIFNYVSLMKNYAYLKIYQPKSFKIFIEKLTSQLNSFSFYKFINLQHQVYQAGIYSVTEKIGASKTQWSGPLQAGFSTNFYNNNLQPFTFITASVVRLAICWILYKIFKASYFQASNSQRFLCVSSQFHSIIPIVILPSFNLIITQIASRDYAEKINSILHIIVLLVCLLIPFIHLLTKFKQIQTRISKDTKTLSSQIKKYNKTGKIEDLQLQIEPTLAGNLQVFKVFNEKRKLLIEKRKNAIAKAKYKLFQRLTLLSIPIFVVFKQGLPFLLVNLCTLLNCFVLSLRLRKYLSTYQFLFNAIISLAWVLYHSTFCAYFIIQKWFFDQKSVKQAEEISKYVGYASIVIILFGAVVQILDCLLGIFLAVKQIVLCIYKKIKKMEQKVLQVKNSSQNKNKNVFNPKINNQENSSIGKSPLILQKDSNQILRKEQIKTENKICCPNKYKNSQLSKFQQPSINKQNKIQKNFNESIKLFTFQQLSMGKQKQIPPKLKAQNIEGRKIKKTRDQMKNKSSKLMVQFKILD